MAPLRIGLLGASGETGKSIADGLLAEGGDIVSPSYNTLTPSLTLTQVRQHVIALTRPASLDKPANKELSTRGIELRALELPGPHDALVAALQDIQILISAIAPFDQLAQIPLATAAKEAGVQRFFPCAAVSVIPAGGVHYLRDEKEKVYNHVKKIGLSYTIIDVGWWYQLSWPRVPSGKLDAFSFHPDLRIAGAGNVPSALTDVRDIGLYFAKLVRDERTRDKYVLVYNEMWTQNQVWDAISRIAGEDVPKVYNSVVDLESTIASAKAALESGSVEPTAVVRLIGAQYEYSWGVRGDNTPEYAKFLGYVTSKELYPDLEYTGFEAYLEELLGGKGKGIYEERREDIQKLLKAAGRG